MLHDLPELVAALRYTAGVNVRSVSEYDLFYLFSQNFNIIAGKPHLLLSPYRPNEFSIECCRCEISSKKRD
jgi:hypothetical protein